MDDLDEYRGTIAVKEGQHWRWCYLQPDYETVARKSEPNKHLRIQRIDGKPFDLAEHKFILMRGALLSEKELLTVASVKHGVMKLSGNTSECIIVDDPLAEVAV